MTYNLDELLRALENYHSALQMHRQQVHEAYREIEQGHHYLTPTYEGRAAEEFHRLFSQATMTFQEYVDATQRMERILEERISSLSNAAREGNL